MDLEERVQQRTVQQVGNVPVPHFREQIAEVVTVFLQEGISWCLLPFDPGRSVEHWRRLALLRSG